MSLVKRITIDGTSYDIAPANMDSVPTTDSENPISSGGIKSYLESSYVPLSATQAPVTGLTDILTPVNLLPNSDFSRSGGYASSLTFESINSGIVTYVCHGWAFHANAASLPNVTITRGANSLRFQGTISNSDGETANGGVLILRNMEYKLPIRSHTIGCKTIDNAGTLNHMGIFGSTTTETLYQKPWTSDDNDFLYVLLKSVSSHQAGYILYFDAGTNVSFDITISNCFVYDGQFKNPPITTSLDVKPNNQFELKHNSLEVTRGSGPHWFRLLTIPNAVTLMTNGTTKFTTRHYCEAILAQGYTSGNNESYSIHKIICGFAITRGLNFNSMALKVDSIISGEFITYSKFRLAIDNRSKPSSQANVPLYIEGYYAGTVNASPDYLLVEVDTDSIIEAGEGAIGDNDILIGSEVTPNKISTNITMPTLS